MKWCKVSLDRIWVAHVGPMKSYAGGKSHLCPERVGNGLPHMGSMKYTSLFLKQNRIRVFCTTLPSGLTLWRNVDKSSSMIGCQESNSVSTAAIVSTHICHIWQGQDCKPFVAFLVFITVPRRKLFEAATIGLQERIPSGMGLCLGCFKKAFLGACEEYLWWIWGFH